MQDQVFFLAGANMPIPWKQPYRIQEEIIETTNYLPEVFALACQMSQHGDAIMDQWIEIKESAESILSETDPVWSFVEEQQTLQREKSHIQLKEDDEDEDWDEEEDEDWDEDEDEEEWDEDEDWDEDEEDWDEDEDFDEDEDWDEEEEGEDDAKE